VVWAVYRSYLQLLWPYLNVVCAESDSSYW
jgi:hypothetical protein